MTDQLKELRLRLDAVAQLTADLTLVRVPILSGYKASDQINRCTQSLYMAKAWAGKLLGEFGGESPYKNEGKRVTVEDIEPTDSVAQVLCTTGFSADLHYKDMTSIQKIDWIRQHLGELADIVKFIDAAVKLDTREKSSCRTQIWTYLVEARLHLGFELERLRNNQ